MKVIVLGVGSMGSAACDHIAQRGAEVLGLDRFAVPHEFGSHHGESRMIRQSYFEHPDYVPLLLRAYELWRDLENRADCEILHETGGLYLGPPDCEIVTGALRAAHEHGLDHELLDAAALGQRFPQFAVPDSFKGFCECRAGFVRPERAIEAHVEQAVRNGATILGGQRVESWNVNGDGVEVHTKSGSHRGDRLVITAGAWAKNCLDGLSMPLEVTRQLLGWFRPKGDPDQFRAGRFPCWFVETDAPFGHYGFPLNEESGTVKLALHKPGLPIDPDRLPEENITPDNACELKAFLDEFIPDAAGELATAKLCLYTNTPDGHFVLGEHPQHERVAFAAGFSGHGYKFASVVGEILADLALDGCTSHPICLFDPARFRKS